MWLDDITTRIESASLGQSAVTLWHGSMPDDDGQDGLTINLMIEPGTAYFTGQPGIAWEQPTMQLGVRHADYATAWNRITAIRDELVLIVNETIGGTAFLFVEPGTIEDYDRDPRERQIFVCTFAVSMQ